MRTLQQLSDGYLRSACKLTLVGGLVAACVACGGDDAELFAADSFSGRNEDVIVANCQHTVDCINQMQGAAGLPDKPYENCQQTTAGRLESMPDKQSQFLNNHSRCARFVACEYANCASTNALSFGQSQMPNIANDCEQRLVCKDEQGIAIADRSFELANCVDVNVMALNQLDPANQRRYVDTYPTCTALSGCAFVSCLWP